MTIQAAHPATPEPPDHHDIPRLPGVQQPSSPLQGTALGSRTEALKMLQMGPPAWGPWTRWTRTAAWEGWRWWRTLGARPGGFGFVTFAAPLFLAIFVDVFNRWIQHENNMIYGLLKGALKGSRFEAEPSEPHPSMKPSSASSKSGE